MRVTLVSAWANRVDEQATELADGATLGDALVIFGIADVSAADVGIWGKSVPLDTALKNGDRIERYRALIADPKLARHLRAHEQGYRWQGRTRRAAKVTPTTNENPGSALK